MNKRVGADQIMSKTENIPCDIETAKHLRIAVVRKYGKFKGYFGLEITKAVAEHTKKLELELAEK